MLSYLRNSLFITLISFTSAFAQSGVHDTSSHFDFDAFKKDVIAFVNVKTGSTFAPMEEWTCVDGSGFDLYKTNAPAIVYLGMESCAPCRFNLPILAGIATELRYSGYDFIYMTPDDSATVSHELNSKKSNGYKKFKIISVSKKYIDHYNLVHGYPTVYFLNSDKTVNDVVLGGNTDNEEKIKKWWQDQLNMLK